MSQQVRQNVTSPGGAVLECRFRYRPRGLVKLVLVVPLFVMLSGCGDASRESGPPPAEKPSDSEVRSESPAPQPTSEVSVRVVDRAGYDELIQKYRGKVVLVDFWATWCAPCVAQYAHTVEMHGKYAKQGLVVVSVSMDDVENKDSVLEFLKTKHSTFDNLLSQWGGSEESFTAFEIESGALPHYKVYDRSGDLFKEFAVDPEAEKQFTPDDVEQAVAELLKPTPDR